MMSFRDRLADPRPILLDGGMGMELQRRLPADGNRYPDLWSTGAALSAPAVVEQLHREYVQAGAEVLTATTFRAHASRVKQLGLEPAEVIQAAVQAARSEANEKQIWVAGSQAPLADCYRPDLVADLPTLIAEHRALAHELATAGIDLILVETENNLVEAKIAIESALATGLPVWASFIPQPPDRLLSGESLREAVTAAVTAGVDGVLVNCCDATQAESYVRIFREIVGDRGIRLGVYANTGRINLLDPTAPTWTPTDASEPERYAHYAAQWLAEGATIIGGCCGTTPEHIGEVSKLLKHGFERCFD